MSNSNDAFDALMAALAAATAQADAVDITRVEFSTAGRSFVAYNAKGEAWGGDLTDVENDIEDVKERLLRDTTSGALGRHFAIYQPVPTDVLSTMRGRQTDWKDIFNA